MADAIAVSIVTNDSVARNSLGDSGADPLQGNVLAKSEKKVIARDYWNSGFTMSDPQLALEVRKASRAASMSDKEGLQIVVEPSRQTGCRQADVCLLRTL